MCASQLKNKQWNGVLRFLIETKSVLLRNSFVIELAIQVLGIAKQREEMRLSHMPWLSLFRSNSTTIGYNIDSLL